MIELLFVLIFITVISLIAIYSIRYGITPTPSSSKVIHSILKYLDESDLVSIDSRVAELGSGWGNLVFAISKKYPQVSIEAYEISPIPYYISKLLKLIFNSKNVSLYREDFFKISLSSYNIVLCYLYRGAMENLKMKFESELSNGTIVITHTFAIPTWKPIRIIEVNDLYRTPIYIYKIGES